ncbi:hypothetical protein MMC29_007549 [Sticta canariensis]|nr:hypothetical protein [Sticta canariensis]
MANSNQQTGENPQQGQISNPTRAIVSWVDSAILLALRFILPLLFFTTLLIAGTLAISYTFYLHQPLPEHFTLAISVTFGVLLFLTAAFLVLFYVQRLNRRRASIEADPEANRPRQSVHFGRSRWRTRGNSPHPEDADHDYIRSSRSELGGTPTASPSMRGGNHPGMLQERLGSLNNEQSPGHSVHLPSVSGSPSPSTSLHALHSVQPPLSTLTSSHPAPLASCPPLFFHNPPRAERPSPSTLPSSHHAPLASLPAVRIHSPPPANDHPAFHLPHPGPPVLFPKGRWPAMNRPSGEEEEEGHDWEAINLSTKPWWEERKR